MERKIQTTINTIDAKALFKYFPKEKPDAPYAIHSENKSLCRLVMKQEEEMEDCPLFDQFYREIEKRSADPTLKDKLVIMDFDDIFMPCDEAASDMVKRNKDQLQNGVRDLIENGFDLYAEQVKQPIHMVAFDKSGNMSRKSRITFIDETYFDALNERLNLGMDFSKIKVSESKYYAYRGLYLSSSKRIEHEQFAITPETFIVLQDERKSPENPDRPITGYNYERNVKYITAKENKEASGDKGKVWDFLDEQVMPLKYIETPFDGVGFVSPQYAKMINESLGTHNATSFQLRLPFVKGMLHSVDVHGFLAEYNTDQSVEKQLYVDAFGIARDLSKAHIFVTESMFKVKNWLVDYLQQTASDDKDPMAFYCDMLKKYDHALYVSGTNLPYGHSKYVHLSYQTINTLDFTEEQFRSILGRHKYFIENPEGYLKSADTAENAPNWKKALSKNPSLSDDIYIRHELKNTQKGLLTKLATGKILVEGQTRYLCRDLLPLLVSMLKKPKNFFSSYLYYNFYLPTDGSDALADALGLDFHSYYAFFRNPHLSRNEQYIMRRFCDTDEETYRGRIAYRYYQLHKKIYDKYFGKLTGIVMVPRHSALPLCLGGADFDGDLVSVVYNQEVVRAVSSGAFRETESKYGTFYERALPVIEIPATTGEKIHVQNHVPYAHIKNTFSNRIGQISDMAIAIGQLEYGHALNGNAEQTGTEPEKGAEEQAGTDAKTATPTCPMCTILTGLEIDAAKNGEHPNLDIILNNRIEPSAYIAFLHQLKRLRSEAGYAFGNLSAEAKEHGKKACIEVTAKGCKTIARFDTQEFGTFINELPIAFYEAFCSYTKHGKIEKDGKNAQFFPYENKDASVEKIESFKVNCQHIFDDYFFFSHTVLSVLRAEKSKGFYANENLENVLYQIYDEEEVQTLQRSVVPQLIGHFKEYMDANHTVADIKDRVNEKRWLLQPKDKREAALEEIIGNGFKASVLAPKEKELLFDFRNHGYKNLWHILSIIEGPKSASFEEIMARNIGNDRRGRIAECNEKLLAYAKAYYEDNAADAGAEIYAACLEELKRVIYNAGLSEQNRIAALYEVTGSARENRKFFWDAFCWDSLNEAIGEMVDDK